MILAMIVWLRHLLGCLVSAIRSRQDLILENLALRQQLLALHAQRPRRRLTAPEKLFRVVGSQNSCTCRYNDLTTGYPTLVETTSTDFGRPECTEEIVSVTIEFLVGTPKNLFFALNDNWLRVIESQARRKRLLLPGRRR